MLDLVVDNVPTAVEMEQTLLGGILLNNGALVMVEGLRPEHFHEPVHQRIFEAMQKRYAEGKAIEFISLKAQFDKDEALTDIGGGVYLAKLARAADQSFYPTEIADELKAIYAKRKLIEHCRETIGNILNTKESAEILAAELGKKIDDLTHDTAVRDIQTAYQVGCEILQDLKNDVKPYSTGLQYLDQAMAGGLYPGKAYGFAARKKVGKTIMGATISHNLAKQGVKHLFICGEMGSKEVHQRVLSRLTDTYPSAFTDGYGKSKDFLGKLGKAVTDSGDDLLYWNAPGLTFEKLQQKLSIAVHKYKITGFILDYWQLVGGKTKGQSDASHLDEVAQWIANFGKKHKLWSITMAQINQEGNTRGGEGIRLAFDQVYALKGMGKDEDISKETRWLQMLDTRYTKWINVGDEDDPGLYLQERGLYFTDNYQQEAMLSQQGVV